MPKSFAELMEQFRNPGDAGLPETFADDLTETYTEELSIRDAAVTERENLLAERQKEIDAAKAETIRLKAVNYDLLVAAPKAGKPAEDNEPEGAGEPAGVDSLFE
jgi:hypothetical protein